jgi:hypothetical protein
VDLMVEHGPARRVAGRLWFPALDPPEPATGGSSRWIGGQPGQRAASAPVEPLNQWSGRAGPAWEENPESAVF